MYTTDTASSYNVKCLFIAVVVLALLGGMLANAAVDENTVAVWLFEEGTGKDSERRFRQRSRWRICRESKVGKSKIRDRIGVSRRCRWLRC